ncbi:MAG: J domain-containing protein [Elainellaceae cyanobacterium]
MIDTSSSSTGHYTLLQVSPWASPQDIRRAYRELSKLYHPDTTALPADVAVAKFQQLNDAYGTLSNPERRLRYDLDQGYSKFSVIQPPIDLMRPQRSAPYESRSAYLDPNDRPLSGGELFALCLLGVTFVGCLMLAIAVGIARGELSF